MYSQGEAFYYEVGDDEIELHVLENVSYDEKEYIVAEDYDGKIYVFSHDEDTDEIERVSDKVESQEVIKFWRDEFLVPIDMKFDDDGYYDLDDDDDDKFSKYDSEYGDGDDDYEGRDD